MTKMNSHYDQKEQGCIGTISTRWDSAGPIFKPARSTRSSVQLNGQVGWFDATRYEKHFRIFCMFWEFLGGSKELCCGRQQRTLLWDHHGIAMWGRSHLKYFLRWDSWTLLKDNQRLGTSLYLPLVVCSHSHTIPGTGSNQYISSSSLA
jgi:hypothetical protein